MIRWPWARSQGTDRLVVTSSANRFAYALANHNGQLRRCGLLQSNGEPAPEFARRIRGLGLPAHRVWAVLPLDEAQLYPVEAPAVRPEEMKAAARWRIKDLIDTRLDEQTIDVMFVGDEQPRPNRQVYVAAARTALIRELGERTRAAGLELSVIDMIELAQRNLQSALAQAEGLGARATAALVQYGNHCLLTICAGGELYYARRLDWAGLPAAGAPAAPAQATANGATLEQHDFVDYGDESTASGGTAGEAPRLVVELQRSFDVWERSWPDLPLATLWVHAGESSTGLATLLQLALGQTVRVLDAERVFPGFSAAAQDRQVNAAVLPLLGALLRTEVRRA